MPVRQCTVCHAFLPSWEVHERCWRCVEDVCLQDYPCFSCEPRSQEQWTQMFGALRDVLRQRQPPSPPNSAMSKSAVQRRKAALAKFEREGRRLESVLGSVSYLDQISFGETLYFCDFLQSQLSPSDPGFAYNPLPGSPFRYKSLPSPPPW